MVAGSNMKADKPSLHLTLYIRTGEIQASQHVVSLAFPPHNSLTLCPWFENPTCFC